MAFISFQQARIAGIAACVPRNISKNSELTQLLAPEDIEKTIESIGIKEKRFADPGVTPSDLAFKAAEQLLTSLKVDKSTIDVLIFMSQSPDYYTPATAPILQHRLGLPIDTAAFDICLACSGWVYALSTAFAYASQPGIRNVLLLNGETFSQLVSPRDKVNAPLYGDAGTATLIEHCEDSPSHFLLNSDGAGHQAILIPAGGARQRVSPASLTETEREDGNFRNDLQVYMNGVDVFNFTMLRVPRAIKDLLSRIPAELDQLDYLVFHQANKFMTDFFIKKLKFSAEKAPYCLDRFGNTSSCSIPLTIVSSMKKDSRREKVVFSAFGGGLSWATAFLNLDHCVITDLIEY